jgi:glycosyltransferase involved in cell wall biosynthesis
MAPNVGFIMEQVAGHVTNYRNLRSVAAYEPGLNAIWHEIYYYREGGSIERLRARLAPFAPTYYTGIMRAAWEMDRALRRQRYDAVMTNASVAVFFGRAFRRVPTLIDFDSTPLQIDRMAAYGPGGHDLKPVAALKYRLYRDMLHSATVLQAWSRWARQSAIDEYGVPAERVIVNPPGVDLERWRPGERRAATEAGAPLRVLFVGADFRRKGGPLLLDWHAGQRPDEVELHIVTREPVEPRPGVVVHRDMQPNSEPLLELYRRSDLFVLPSLGECFGIATVEAMASGLPVIASDVGGTADIIEPARNGFIVPGNDGRALAQAIAAILGDPARRSHMGLQSRQLAEQRFDLRRNARLTFDYLKQIASPTATVRGVAVA